MNINAIGDKSYFILSQFNLSLKNLQLKMNIIEPTDNVALIWNILLLASIINFLFSIPLKSSFNIDVYSENFNTVYVVYEFIPMIILIMDVFINFIVAYFENNILIIDVIKIQKEYLKFDFWINILTIISLQ